MQHFICLFDGQGFYEREVEYKKKEATMLDEVLLGFKPRVSCLQDRRFHQLSHSTCVKAIGGVGR